MIELPCADWCFICQEVASGNMEAVCADPGSPTLLELMKLESEVCFVCPDCSPHPEWSI